MSIYSTVNMYFQVPFVEQSNSYGKIGHLPADVPGAGDGGASDGGAGTSPKLNAQKLILTLYIVDKECAKYFNLKQIISTIGK